ncbi:MAG: VWA domain-containing protein, partial [Pirellulaceae bacterium]
NLRYPDVDFLAMVWLRSAEAPEIQGDPADLEQPADPQVNWSDQLRPQGTKTRLGDAVQFLVSKEQGGPIAGIVVFTDGRNNAGDDLETVIRAVRDSRIPIYPVGLGSDRQVQNVRVVDIEAPTRAFPGDRFTITGYLQASGLEGTSIGVELISRPAGTEPGSANEKVEQQQRIDLGTDGQTQAIEFELEPEGAGKREYTFRATVPAEDNNELDNQRSATVEIIDRRTRVLLFAGGPTREYRFLRNLLYRDREIEVHVLLQTADIGASQESDELLLEFPTLADELFEFDCIVAFDPDWQQLDEIQVQLLDRWVAEKSGGLVVIAGPVFTPEWSRLRRGRDSRIDTIKSLYPVVFYNQGGVTLSLGRFGGEAAWPIDFTREGLNSEFLWLDDDQIGSEQAWASFDGVYGYYKAKDAKPGARVFARFSDPETSMDNELPLYMAGHFYGAGRVFFQASGEMWRLRSIDETYFEQYYTKVIRWVSQGRLLRDSSRGVLLVDKDRCLMGDHVMVQAILNDSQHQPLVDDEVTANLVQPDGQRKPLLLQQVTDGTRQGMYSAQFHALMQGDYRIELEIPESAGQDFLTREVQVRIPALEIENPRRNDPLLKEVAQMSNGEYFIGIDSITAASSETESTLAELVAPQDQETTLPGTPDVDFEEQLMAWLIGLISGVLCLEWLFRRLSRLA